MSFKNVSIDKIWSEDFANYTVEAPLQTSYPYGYNLIVSGTQNLNTEITSFTPSAQVHLYEIDLSEISMSTINFNYNGQQPINKGILRIYNDYNIFNLVNNPYGTIKWQDNYYYPFPIAVEGFEYSSAGTLPTPKVSISNLSPDYSYNSFYTYIRMQMQSLGDIIGAKFTRIKTFLKYLDGSNFSQGYNPYNPTTGLYEIELPRDIYYIDRKTVENKNIIEYQLNTILDIENLTLPARTIYAKQCPFQYRGEGCVYEYNSRLTSLHSGVYANTINPSINVKGLLTAPPVATDNNQLFIGGVFSTGVVGTAENTAIFRLTGQLGNSGLWKENQQYVSGDFVFLQNRNLKFYYVCIKNNYSDVFNVPPNINYWVGDACSKSISACRLRWLKNPAFRPMIWPSGRGGEGFIETRNRIESLVNTGERLNLWVTGRNGIPINFPRRPGCEDPSSTRAHGFPKDANGNYLNGFLPFGGFPATNKPQS
jgi:lambda family phage minor tail protein L